ncbi:MAG: hypothetical protein ABH872_05820 [Candidatus Omnitrophota bacterium]
MARIGMMLFACLVFVSCIVFPADAAQTKSYTILVDEHDRPFPPAWYFNATGGDRGEVSEFSGCVSYAWNGDSSYTVSAARVNGLWTWGGIWYSLIRTNNDNAHLDFKNIFGPYIKSQYQGRITALEIDVDSVRSAWGNTGLKLKIELKDKNGNVVHAPWFIDRLTSYTYPRTFTINLDLPEIRNVETVLWMIDGAIMGDSATVGAVKLKSLVPDLVTAPSEEQAFYWTYSWLMSNYNSSTEMVQDRSSFAMGHQENVSATAKAAKVTYYAYKKGYITYSDAVGIITNIAKTLITKVPRGPSGINTIWPHFTQNGGTRVLPPHDEFDGSEWATGDTLYAALDLIAALEMIGDPQNQIPSIEAFLKAIDWDDLLTSDGYICHGYSYSGNKLDSCWQGFGMETVGVNWAYASSTGNVAKMKAPPSDNGSGFNDNVQYPMVFSGVDRWGNDWDAYREEMANIQIGWYAPNNRNNSYLYNAGLFGLSAGESPSGVGYTPYGTYPIQDGNGEVVALHYSGMIADIKPNQAISMWEELRDRTDSFLRDRIIISPLNNMESMSVNKSTGKLTVNHLKGSWNLALQAEGWAMLDFNVKADLEAAIQSNAFLKKGYDLLIESAALVTGCHIFYNNSAFDFNNPWPNHNDDAAIATDKEALLPGKVADFSNYTSYSRGINGIMIDIENLASNPADLNINTWQNFFKFSAGNSDNPLTWETAPAPSKFLVREIPNVQNTHRVTIVWDDGKIVNKWLEVKVLANENHTGLESEDVFYFGNAIAEAGNSTADARVTTTDLLLARNNPCDFSNPAGIDFKYDYNRDKYVNATDVLLARNNQTNFLNCLKIIDLSGQAAQNQALADNQLRVGDVVTIPNNTGVSYPNLVPRADINRDGLVGLGDWGLFRAAFGSKEGGFNYNKDADINQDGTIDLIDYSALRSSWRMNDYVEFPPDKKAYILNWSETEITCEFPQGAESNEATVFAQ